MRVRPPAMAPAALAALVIAVATVLASASFPCPHQRHRRTTLPDPPAADMTAPAALPTDAVQTETPSEAPNSGPTAPSVQQTSGQDDLQPVQGSVQPEAMTSQPGLQQEQQQPAALEPGVFSSPAATQGSGPADVTQWEAPLSHRNSTLHRRGEGGVTGQPGWTSSSDRGPVGHDDLLATLPGDVQLGEELVPIRPGPSPTPGTPTAPTASASSISRPSKLLEERSRRLEKIQRDILERKQRRNSARKTTPTPDRTAGLDQEEDLDLEEKPHHSRGRGQLDREAGLEEGRHAARSKVTVKQAAVGLEERPLSSSRGREGGHLEGRPHRSGGRGDPDADHEPDGRPSRGRGRGQQDDEDDLGRGSKRQAGSSSPGAAAATVSSKDSGPPAGRKKQGRDQERGRRGDRRPTGKRARQDAEELLEDNSLDESWDSTGSSESAENSGESGERAALRSRTRTDGMGWDGHDFPPRGQTEKACGALF